MKILSYLPRMSSLSLSLSLSLLLSLSLFCSLSFALSLFCSLALTHSIYNRPMSGKNIKTPPGKPLEQRNATVYLSASAWTNHIRYRFFCEKLIKGDPGRQQLHPIVQLISPQFTEIPFEKRNELESLHHKLGDLGDSRFCLAPRGWVGWSYRLFEIFAVGCIPVIMSDYTVYPWQQHILDWTRFAIFIRESEISILFEILSTIPHHEVNLPLPPQHSLSTNQTHPYELFQLEELEWGRKIARRSMLYGPVGYPFPRFSPEDMTIMEFALQRKRISVTKLWGKEYY